MDLIKILNSIDFIDGRVDINSVHPTRLNLLVEEGFIDKVDPGDGEACFYIMSEEASIYIRRDKKMRSIVSNWFTNRNN